jgi:hypothetical protein
MSPAAGGHCVDRAEFQALLMGLQTILDEMDWNDELSLERLRRRPATVYWMCDRESLVKSVRRAENGEPEYKRRIGKHLWAQFDFYEPLFHITAVWVKRDTNSFHSVADRVASENRILLRDYTANTADTVQKILADYITILTEDQQIF